MIYEVIDKCHRRDYLPLFGNLHHLICYCPRGSRGILGKEREDDDFFDIGFSQSFKTTFYTWGLVTHGNFHLELVRVQPGHQLVAEILSMKQQGRTPVRPKLLVFDSRFGRPKGSNNKIDQKPTGNKRNVDDPFVHQEFSQVLPNVRGRCTVGGSYVYQQHSCFGFVLMHDWFSSLD